MLVHQHYAVVLELTRSEQGNFGDYTAHDISKRLGIVCGLAEPKVLQILSRSLKSWWKYVALG